MYDARPRVSQIRAVFSFYHHLTRAPFTCMLAAAHTDTALIRQERRTQTVTTGLKVKLLALAWSVGLFGRLIIYLLQFLGLVRVEGIAHLKGLVSEKRGFLVIHRHPSMRETVIIPLLFFPSFLLNPWRLPVVTPDERNYYRPWWCAFFRPAAIPVPRGNGDEEIKALRRMRQALKEGRPLVVAPEGGRTFKGEEFRYQIADGSTEVVQAPGRVLDLSRPIIRRFRNGTQVLCNNGTPVLPVWVDSRRWRTLISFGKPVVFPNGENTKEALEDLLLSAFSRLH